MRYQAAMTEFEVAQALGLGVRTVAPDFQNTWRFLRACLR
jgi:hypothetical protein